MKILPYVYKTTHKRTGEFYIGVRWANKVVSTEDLGKHYFTSSKYVYPRFDEFDYLIIAEFFHRDDAINFEKALINEHWNDPLLLNLSNHISKAFVLNKHSAESKLKMSLAKRGKPPNNKGKKLSAESRAKIAAASKGRKRPQAAIDKSRQFMKGNTYGLGNKSIAGKSLSIETKTKISMSGMGKNIGAIRSAEERKHLSEIAKTRPRLMCMHCNKEYLQMHARHHFKCSTNNIQS